MSLLASLAVDIADEYVTFTLRAENEGEAPIDLTFGSGQTAEFAVSADDEVIWRWSDERMFTQRVRHDTLASGEEIIAEGRWPGPTPGTYTVEAMLVATDHRPSSSATFEV